MVVPRTVAASGRALGWEQVECVTGKGEEIRSMAATEGRVRAFPPRVRDRICRDQVFAS